jgi:hypothetical protein
VITLLLALLACTGAPADDTAADETPFIQILVPADGATVCGTPLVVQLEVRGIRLVDPYPPEGTEPEPGTGHVDVMLNGQDATMSGSEEGDIADVADGAWQLKVELSNADHTPVVPYAGDFVYITVDATVCE